MHKIFSLLVVLSTGIVANGQLSSKQTIQLDSLFRELDHNQLSMGSISIYHKGKECYTNTYGLATYRDSIRIPATGNTLYRIGSVTKLFTAVMIMQLIEEGKLQLDQNIITFFPTLKNAGEITVKSMLEHKSLLPVYVRVDDLDDLRESRSVDELIAKVNEKPANSDTLTNTYNNLNYTLLGLMVEQLDKRSYNASLEARFGHLTGVRFYGTTKLLDYKKNEANSFHLENGMWKEDYEIVECPLSEGSGFMLADARSLNEFMNALNSGKLISEQSLKQMMPHKGAFGFGLMRTPFDAHDGFGHTGRIEGFTAALTMFPEDELSVAFIQNGSVYPLNDILIMVGQILFTDQFVLPPLRKIVLTPEAESLLIGEYFNSEEGYGLIIDRRKGVLRTRIVVGKGLLNKRILAVYALRTDQLFNPQQGIIFDFNHPENGGYQHCEMRVNGARLLMTRLH